MRIFSERYTASVAPSALRLVVAVLWADVRAVDAFVWGSSDIWASTTSIGSIEIPRTAVASPLGVGSNPGWVLNAPRTRKTAEGFWFESL